MKSDVRIDEDGRLLCGFCTESPYMHQADVCVAIRDIEDGPATVVDVRVSGVQVTRATSEVADKKFGRRDQMSIKFWCEECGQTQYLVLRQHKGLTYVKWSSEP